MVNMRQAAREEAHNRLQAQSPASLRRARRRQAYAAQRAARAEARPQEGAETNLEEIPVMAADNTRPDMPIPHDGTRIGAQIPTQVRSQPCRCIQEISILTTALLCSFAEAMY
jgi:hypothetical protein